MYCMIFFIFNFTLFLEGGEKLYDHLHKYTNKTANVNSIIHYCKLKNKQPNYIMRLT